MRMLCARSAAMEEDSSTAPVKIHLWEMDSFVKVNEILFIIH